MAGIIIAYDIVIARALGPEGKGYYSLLTISPLLISTIAGFGLDYALNFHGHREPNRTDSIYSTVFLLGTALSCLFCLPLITNASGSLSWLYGGVPLLYRGTMLMSLGIVPLEVMFTLTTMFAMTVGGSIIFGKMRIVRRMIVLVGALLMFFGVVDRQKYGITFMVIVWMTSVIVSVVYCLKRCGYRWAKPDFKIGLLFKEGMNAYPGRVSERLQRRVDVILLGMMSSGVAVGVYSVATGISEMLFFISGSLSSVLFSRNVKENESSHLTAFRVMVPIGFSLAAIVGALAVFIIPVCYGKVYSGSTLPLLLLLPGVVFMSLVQIISPYLVQSGLIWAISIGQVIGLLSNVAINIALIHRFGPVGAAVASTMSYGITLIVIIILLVRIKNINLSQLFILDSRDIAKIINRISSIVVTR